MEVALPAYKKGVNSIDTAYLTVRIVLYINRII